MTWEIGIDIYTLFMHAKSLQLCLTLCNPVDCSPPGSSVHGFPRQEYRSGLPFPSPGELPDPRIEPVSSALAGGFLTTEPPGKPQCMYVKVKSLSRVRLFCDPVDCRPPDSSVHGILQARILEWVAIAFSRGSSQPRDQTQVSHVAGRLSNL